LRIGYLLGYLVLSIWTLCIYFFIFALIFAFVICRLGTCF
jgi:hypothetical protein